jgi:putative addiction module killer protein
MTRDKLAKSVSDRIHSKVIEIRQTYYARKGKALVILLAGGDKGTQAQDIKNALELAGGL